MPEGYRRLPKVVNQAGDGYRRFDCGVSEIEQGEVREAHGVQTLGSEPQITADNRRTEPAKKQKNDGQDRSS